MANVLKGLVAGAVAGMVASWVMNEFIAGPGGKLATAITHAQGQEPQPQTGTDSTAQLADTATVVATGGRHLTYEAQTRAGSVIHYTFGALMGGLYGAFAELVPSVTSGFGTAYASALFAGADLIAVPALNLGKYADEQGAGPVTEYYAAHLVYGICTESTRRLVRAAL